jgi:ribosomal protein S30
MTVSHIQDYEKYHGAVIMKLLQGTKEGFSKLILVGSVKDLWGVYQITLNTPGSKDKKLYILRSKTPKISGQDKKEAETGQDKKGAKTGKKWLFPISDTKLSKLCQDIFESEEEVWMALICGEKNKEKKNEEKKNKNEKEYVCLLLPKQLKKLLDDPCKSKPDRIIIYVSFETATRFRVRVGRGKPLIVPRDQIISGSIMEENK